jgi:hypothetical protein
MTFLSALIKFISFGFLAGFLMSIGPNLGNAILPLAGLMVFVSTILVLVELTNREPATSGAIEAV